jgi:prophage antirepressor-like protein
MQSSISRLDTTITTPQSAVIEPVAGNTQPRKMTRLLSGIFDGHNIRTPIDEQGNVWFVATDVCRILGLNNTTMALKRVSDNHKQLVDLLRVNNQHSNKNNDLHDWQKDIVNIINESGLYELISRSNKPEARRFQKWIHAEILPSVRKTGLYIDQGSPVQNAAVIPHVGRDLLGWERLMVEGAYRDAVLSAPDAIRNQMRRHLRRDMRVICDGFGLPVQSNQGLRVRSNADVTLLIDVINKGADRYRFLLSGETKSKQPRVDPPPVPPRETKVEPVPEVTEITVVIMGYPLILKPKWYRPLEIEKMVARCTDSKYGLTHQSIGRVSTLLGMKDSDHGWSDLVRSNSHTIKATGMGVPVYQYHAKAVEAIIRKAVELGLVTTRSGINGELPLQYIPMQ